MSELQKWITSISGAVVGQMVVLGFFYLLVFNSTSPNLSAKSAAPQPREVTVMLSQLIKPDPPEPIPDQSKPDEAAPPDEEAPPEPPPFKKQFIDTDSNTAQVDAPKNSRFESDRNTYASTEFLPDPTKPQVAGPTLRGEEKIRDLNVADQEYVRGEIEPDPTPMPTPPSEEQQLTTPPVPETLVERIQDTPPSEMNAANSAESLPAEKESGGEDEENQIGEADRPPQDPVGDMASQPDTTKIGPEARVATAIPSFENPGDSAMATEPPREIGDVDQTAMATSPAENKAEPRDLPQKRELKAIPVASGAMLDPIKTPEPTPTPEVIQKKLDESMFNPAYLAQRRKNNQNGDITNLGEGSVDAESTEVGKYKKAVNQAIGKKWHEYRQDRADHVTWGLLQLKFTVTPAGKVRDLVITKKEATELVTEFSLLAIAEAKIPRMPADAAAELGSRGLEMHYNIVIY